MKRFALKVSAITLLSILTLSAIFAMFLTLFFPQKAAKFCDGLGNSGGTINYAEKAYLKSDSLGDLIFLVNMVVKYDDDRLTEKYAPTLLGHSAFPEYIKSISNGSAYYDFVASQYLESVYKLGEMSNADLSAIAMDYSSDYRNSNAVQGLIVNAFEQDDKPLLNVILAQLESFEQSNNCPLGSKTILLQDIQNLKIILGQP